MRTVLDRLIRLYQRAVSPYLGHWCRFEPSCSEYTRRALRRHGVLRGLWMGAGRILRCNPFSRGGWDPVPPAPDGSSSPSVDQTSGDESPSRPKRRRM